jgi:hypothetical protein
MAAQWVRSYRPDPGRLDERPVNLSGGFITHNTGVLVAFTIATLRKRGHVILQRYNSPEDTYAARRAREAIRWERRW